MQSFTRPLTAVALIAVSTISAAASQGPGTSVGTTATGLAQSLFFGAVVAAACIGLAFRLKRN